MDRYIVYKNESGVHFVDTVNANFNSMDFNGACWDTYSTKGNFLFHSYDTPDEDSIPGDISFSTTTEYIGEIIYSTNDYQKVRHLAHLEIEEIDLWEDYTKWVSNKKGIKK